MFKISYSKSFSLFSLLLFCTVALQGCSTQVTSERPPNQREQQPIVEVTPEETDMDTAILLEQAKSSSGENSVIFLLRASASFLGNQQPEKALFIVQQLQAMPLTTKQQDFNYLNAAQALFHMSEFSLAQQQLNLISKPGNSSREYQLRALLAQKQNLKIEAISALLHLYQQDPITSEAQIDHLADMFAKLTPFEKAALKKANPPGLTPWLSFNDIVAQYAQHPISLDFQFKKWRSQYPIHPLNNKIKLLLSQSNTLDKQETFKNIAVIIPLSGREQTLGGALQTGILAANGFNNAQNITFYDSNQIPMQDILISLEAQQPDAVIGPLLKHHVKQFLSLTRQQDVEPQWTNLLLNVPEDGQLLPSQYALSMLPEEEALQAAFSLSRKGYKKALVLSQNTAIGKRMANAFGNQWQQQTGVTPSVIYYPNGKQMQQSVKSGLDVNFSEQRIIAMKQRMKESIETETRNRRDIDVIYIFATSNQAKLLKPYIDVNISPFADNIPIFASSRSNNDSQNRNTRRDLTGLTFTEIPWLLSGKENNKELLKQAKTIWPKRSNSLQRIYALGIDSLQVLNKLKTLEQFPMVRHQGEIGTLQMQDNRIISRSLEWGRYRSSRVQALEMD